jgi:hypothetical protein
MQLLFAYLSVVLVALRVVYENADSLHLGMGTMSWGRLIMRCLRMDATLNNRLQN